MRTTLALLLLVTATFAGAQDIAFRPFETEGFAALNRKDFAGCAKTFASATDQYKEEPSPPFVTARCYAELHDAKRAQRYLAIALDRGYRNCRSVARQELLATFHELGDRCEANADAFVKSTNPELLAAYLADRAERSGDIADPAATMRRDAARRDVVRIAIAMHALQTADDYLHAALVMQHGTTADDFALARNLAKKAVGLRPWLAEARWLFAAATDRHLHALGKPQIYGTQYQQVDGRWTLEPFDPDAISDEERARWRTHSLAERRRFIDELNAAAPQ